eukprot:TRINITY_DN12410_c0_g1_i12.p1 TRINITY_DN12410_c0_g1~~TRINITY_DN12410_c0_g1_i12.p1  ORF type:complete len:115 (+),score=12.25 TRINITY_DN12410_c0_g1_i12:269-613(+)
MPSRTAFLTSRRPDTTKDWTISPNLAQTSTTASISFRPCVRTAMASDLQLVNNVTLHLGDGEHSLATEDESGAQWDAVHINLASLVYDIFDTLDNIDNSLSDACKLIQICKILF